MSICPDKELFSAYSDGEVPSPWKEKLEDHIGRCSDCSKTFSAYQKLHDVMQQAGETPAIDLTASFEKLSIKRQDVLLARYSSKFSYEDSWLHRSVKIPLPTIAAAALLLAVCSPLLFFAKKNVPDEFIAVESDFKPIVPSAFFYGNSNSLPIHELAVKKSLYSRDLPLNSITKQAASNQTVAFTVGDFAKLYGINNKNFNDDQMVIIRLPITKLRSLNHFNNEDNTQTLVTNYSFGK